MDKQIEKLCDSQLLKDTKSLREKERALGYELLPYFAEVDCRKLYRDEGYPSFYAYLQIWLDILMVERTGG